MNNNFNEELRDLEELQAELQRLQNEQQDFWNMVEAELKSIPVAMQLHLELDLSYSSEEELEILRTYGRMKEGISRDIIVPGTMTLHALHYAIMRAFGWQNTHLHSYMPYEDEFKKMTNGGKVREWTRQVGMYFRFPQNDFQGQFWDDDYDEDQNFKTWLRSKYCAPYYYDGTEEYYPAAQAEVEKFRKAYPAIQKKSTDQRTWNVYCDRRCEEMIERPRICSVLKTPADQGDWNSWKAAKDAALKPIEKKRKSVLEQYGYMVDKLEALADKVEEYMEKNETPTEDMLPCFQEFEALDYELERFCSFHDPEPVPALSALRYRYDYGDDWEIKITCTNAWYDRSVYARDENGNMRQDRNGFVPEKVLFVDASEQPVENGFQAKLQEIAGKGKPVCVAWDGLNVLDDVGGVGGFCHFLRRIHGKDSEDKKELREWAKSQGWTGRMAKPENIL